MLEFEDEALFEDEAPLLVRPDDVEGFVDDLLEASQSVTDIAATKSVSRPAVSQHLKVLKDAGLVSVSQQGSHRIYAAKTENLLELRAYLNRAWDEGLQAYAREITKRNKSR